MVLLLLLLASLSLPGFSQSKCACPCCCLTQSPPAPAATPSPSRPASASVILKVAPRARREVAQSIETGIPAYGIDTEIRAAHFLAQMAHESGGFRYLSEIWGPTPAQRRYDGRMGNRAPGDGFKYRGRGIIQLTGRNNYREFGRRLNLDLEGQPDLAARPEVAVKVSGEFWNARGLSPLADRDDVRAVTRRINGGFNGFRDRVRWLTLFRAAIKQQQKASG